MFLWRHSDPHHTPHKKHIFLLNLVLQAMLVAFTTSQACLFDSHLIKTPVGHGGKMHKLKAPKKQSYRFE